MMGVDVQTSGYRITTMQLTLLPEDPPTSPVAFFRIIWWTGSHVAA